MRNPVPTQYAAMGQIIEISEPARITFPFARCKDRQHNGTAGGVGCFPRFFLAGIDAQRRFQMQVVVTSDDDGFARISAVQGTGNVRQDARIKHRYRCITQGLRHAAGRRIPFTDDQCRGAGQRGDSTDDTEAALLAGISGKPFRAVAADGLQVRCRLLHRQQPAMRWTTCRFYQTGSCNTRWWTPPK